MTDVQEAQDGIGALAEEDADAFERVLEFMYTGAYHGRRGTLELVLRDANDISHSHGCLTSGDDDGDDSMSALRLSEELMIHTEVYLLAKFLNISPLIQQATNLFTAAIEEDFSSDALIEPSKRVFSHGDDGGFGLRAQIVKLCVKFSYKIQQQGELYGLLMEHEPVAWRLLSWQEGEHSHELMEIYKTHLILKERQQDLRREIEVLSREKGAWTTEKASILSLLEKHDNCRNCGKGFGSYMDKHERGVVRCKDCRCRHYQ